MDLQLLPWIKDDIAIEIIGRMSAEQVEKLYQLLAEYRKKGFERDSQEVENDQHYQLYMDRIGVFKAEIDQIYEGKNLEELYRKVDEEYVPYLNKSQTGTVKFFSETKGFNFFEHNEREDDVVPASELNDHENKTTTPESTTHVNDRF